MTARRCRHIARSIATALIALACASLGAAELPQRQHLWIVGSSTAYPIVTAAAEQFGRTSEFTTPVVESTGSGGGIKLFCGGTGLGTPDISMASRPMKETERQTCIRNKVYDIREIKIGYDGIVLASATSAPALSLSSRDLYLALARKIPNPADHGRLIDNPYQRWNEIDPELPDLPIRVLGPPPTSGTRDILAERLLEPGCLTLPTLQDLFKEDPVGFRRHCHAVREDGAFVNAGENDARLVRKLINDPDAVGIFGYSFLDQNRHNLKGAQIDGIAPTFEMIESYTYPLSRPLFLYVKPTHARWVSGLNAFVDSVTSAALSGPEGYLVDRGLIPLRGDERATRTRDIQATP